MGTLEGRSSLKHLSDLATFYLLSGIPFSHSIYNSDDEDHECHDIVRSRPDWQRMTRATALPTHAGG